MLRFGDDGFQKKAVVEIVDFDLLYQSLNEQVGSRGDYGPISYISGEDRNHFTKHVDDNWMDEFRIVWDVRDNSDLPVSLPAGIGKMVPLDQLPD